MSFAIRTLGAIAILICIVAAGREAAQGQARRPNILLIVADDLGVPFDDIEVVHGDTNRVQMGIGTFGSRSMAVGGTAVRLATGKIIDKARKVAAHLLEVAEADLDFANGVFQVKGAPERSKTIQDVALMAFLAHNWPEGLEPGLEAQSFFDRMLDYFASERDLRGFDPVHGWMHTVAHTSDALKFLARNPKLGPGVDQRLLAAVAAKIAAADAVFAWGENDRMALALQSAVRRGDASADPGTRDPGSVGGLAEAWVEGSIVGGPVPPAIERIAERFERRG